MKNQTADNVKSDELTAWLLEADEPWTQYRTYIDLLERPETDTDVRQSRKLMLNHPKIRVLISSASEWGIKPLKRHNDASHPLYALSALAEFGLSYDDPGIAEIVDEIITHQSPQGAFETLCNIHPRYGGTGSDMWSWFNCDAPTVLKILTKMQAPYTNAILKAREHVLQSVSENGWHCGAAPELGKFRGPGRMNDPCPIATLYALGALLQFRDLVTSDAVRQGAEMLLWHWEHQKERKLYLFGIGTDFRKLKYPFVWYDILHVVEILSQINSVHDDPRFKEMVTELLLQGDQQGRFRASSMYRAWKGWSFADKKNPSPLLTFLVLRILKRL
ncbi:MAG: hypothetical protein P1S60_06485 [Anaerolineae bacterium]|nr:hypothetical protein [Anaerolineae bacterium]